MNPPRKSRGIQDLLLPVATKEMHRAINHMSKASLRITRADYTTGKHATVISFIVSTGSSELPEFYAAPVMVLIFVILLPNIFFAVTSS